MDIAERREAEDLYDIKEAEALYLSYGDRFIGWYLFKKYLKNSLLPLNYAKDREKQYEFKIYDYNFRFIMPSSIEFSQGKIFYSEAERRFGVFRFPRKPDGSYLAPLKFNAKNAFKSLDGKQLKELVENRNVLVFEAFKVPRFGFEYPMLTDEDLKKIESLTDQAFVQSLNNEYERGLKERISEVKNRIESLPNYLLILKDILDLRLKDSEEFSKITNGVIHL